MSRRRITDAAAGTRRDQRTASFPLASSPLASFPRSHFHCVIPQRHLHCVISKASFSTADREWFPVVTNDDLLVDVRAAPLSHPSRRQDAVDQGQQNKADTRETTASILDVTTLGEACITESKRIG